MFLDLHASMIVMLAIINFGFLPLWFTPILLMLGGLITGAITKFGWDGIEKVIPPFEKIPSYVKPFAVAVLGVIINTVAAWINTPLPTDLHLWNATVLGSVVTAVFAWLTDKIQKDQAAKAAGGAVGAVPAAPLPTANTTK